MREATGKALAALRKSFGDDSALLLSEMKSVAESAISTGHPAIDFGLLGIGGLPRGRFVEIYGKEKTGKTSLILTCIAAFQRECIVPVVLDPKLSVGDDIERAIRIGVDPEDLILHPIKTSEDATGILGKLIEDSRKDGLELAFVWDDAAMTDTKSTREKNVAEKARVMWDFCRKLSGVCYRTNTTLLIVNHLIADIGKAGFGNPSTTTGGGGVRAAARIRIKLSKMKTEAVSGRKVGQIVRMVTEANAYFRPQCVIDTYLDFVNGYDSARSVLINAVDANIVLKSKGKYHIKGSKKTPKTPQEFTGEEILEIAKMVWASSTVESPIDSGDDGIEVETLEDDELDEFDID